MLHPHPAREAVGRGISVGCRGTTHSTACPSHCPPSLNLSTCKYRGPGLIPSLMPRQQSLCQFVSAALGVRAVADRATRTPRPSAPSRPGTRGGLVRVHSLLLDPLRPPQVRGTGSPVLSAGEQCSPSDASLPPAPAPAGAGAWPWGLQAASFLPLSPPTKGSPPWGPGGPGGRGSSQPRGAPAHIHEAWVEPQPLNLGVPTSIQAA